MEFRGLLGSSRKRGDGSGSITTSDPYGEWGPCVREVARYELTRYGDVFRKWPLRELLLAYRERERAVNRDRFQFLQLRWAILRAAGFKLEEPVEPKI